MATPDSPSPSYEAPFRHFVANRSMLTAYVMAIVRDPTLAEDVVSDTAVEIANCWSTYDLTRPFPNWARGVARRVALTHLRRFTRDRVLPPDDVLEGLGCDLDAFGTETELEARKRVLQHCLDELPAGSRQLVELRYFENHPYENIAAATRRSLNALYIAFSRIHDLLTSCMTKAMKES